MNIRQANEISITDFLEREGITPDKKRGDNYWYLSPLRTETTPSFCVNRSKNIWHDFGTGQGGDLIDLVRQMRGLQTMSDALHSLENDKRYERAVSATRLRNVMEEVESKMRNIKLLPLQSHALQSYFFSRKIDIDIGRMYCREIHYDVYDKSYFAVAFGNVSGGFEIRNPYFKGCIGRKDISLIVHTFGSRKDNCAVFEGFMDFLSYLTLVKRNDKLFLLDEKCDCLIMNSVCNLKLCLKHLEYYSRIHCFLDNDLAGQKTVETIKGIYEYRVTDESFRYAEYKDVNDYLLGRKM